MILRNSFQHTNIKVGFSSTNYLCGVENIAENMVNVFNCVPRVILGVAQCFRKDLAIIFDETIYSRPAQI